MRHFTGTIKAFAALNVALLALRISGAAYRSTDERERGDVPGWVMIFRYPCHTRY
ncbi:hypothetical protein [Arthrobacter sp. H5]|uniref:hypothetical protein n=1 Tax=Arthrobacter sp. H5 TaxID=1267973 RepID=UPI0004B7BCB8|nr:hypothetical protein [Arthrobacter sp. H5]